MDSLVGYSDETRAKVEVLGCISYDGRTLASLIAEEYKFDTLEGNNDH